LPHKCGRAAFFHHTGEILNDQHNWALLKVDMEKAFLADADKEPDTTEARRGESSV
jgi:hypothetical protein